MWAIKRLALLLAVLTLWTGTGAAQGVLTPAASGTSLTVKELDGSPSATISTLKVTNGSLTDNGDGSATLATSGAANVTIGSSAVTGGTVGGVLYVATGPVMQQLTGAGLLVSNSLAAPTIYAGTTCTNQVVRLLSASGAATCVTITSAYVDSSIGVTASPLSQFAATTSAQLAGVLSDESGTSGGFARATGADLAPNTLNIPHSTTLPATCNVGDQYMDTDAASGQRIYACESANTWALQGDGGGGGSGGNFDSIGSGTNTSATMTCGAGCQMVPASTGVVAATAVRPSITTVNAGNSPYTATVTDYILLCDTTAGSRTINLPAATNKILLRVKNLGSNTCTVNRNGTDTIDGGTSAALTLQYQALDVVGNGSSAWSVF